MLEPRYAKIFLMALPLMFGTLLQSIIAVTDAVFVSSLGTIAFDAVGNGSLLYMALFMFARGLSDGTQLTGARLFGEGNKSSIGKVLLNAQFIQLFMSALIFISFFTFGRILIESIAKSGDIAAAMTEFINYRSWGIFFASLEVTTAAFFIGLGRTKIIYLSLPVYFNSGWTNYKYAFSTTL